jgi:uncharacterized protein YxjI
MDQTQPDYPTQPSYATDTTDLLQLSTLVVKQQMKVFEVKNQYEVYDETGQLVGRVTQVRQSALTILARIFSNLDVVLPVHLEVTDAAGQPVLLMDKPWFRWAVQARRPDGTNLGTVTKQIRMGKARFALSSADGTDLGAVHAQNWRAKDFAIFDADGRHVGEVNKKWAGLRELFTDADTYVVQVHPHTVEPLRSLAVASCLTIDTIMKQKDSGGGFSFGS